MAKVKLIFEDRPDGVYIDIEGTFPDTIEEYTDAQILMAQLIETLKIQESLNKLIKKEKSLTNTEKDDKTKYNQ